MTREKYRSGPAFGLGRYVIHAYWSSTSKITCTACKFFVQYATFRGYDDDKRHKYELQV